MYNEYLKRFFDFFISLLLLLILSPILFLTIIILFIYNKGNPFFIQRRPGRNEKIFKIIKFKTMNDKKGQDGQLLPDAIRLTYPGKLIRKFSIDELPQLINVLKGDMSLIGPRPLLKEYLSYYSTRERKRHDIRPGITGWAQVNGRNFLEWDKRLDLDVYYVENISLKLDFIIFFRTIKNIVFRKDIVVVPSNKLKPLNFYREKK